MAERLAAVLRGARSPGVYRWRSRAHPAALRRDLLAAGWGLYLLDGRTVTGTGRLFEALRREMALPAWSGHSWEGLSECLVDLSWLPGRGHLLLWDRYGALAQADIKAWQRMYGACTAAAADRQRHGAPPLYVLLRGCGPDEVPWLG